MRRCSQEADEARAARGGREPLSTSPYPWERLYASRCSGGVAAVRVRVRVRAVVGVRAGVRVVVHSLDVVVI